MSKKLKPKIKLKTSLSCDDLLMVEPSLLAIMSFISAFCQHHDIDFIVSSMIRTEAQNEAVGSKSKTHVEGRAFDFSIKKHHGWTMPLIQKLVDEVNNEFHEFGAISFKDLISRPIVIHGQGDNRHAHVQVRPNARWRF